MYKRQVVGYLTYLDLIKDLIEGKETVGTAMMQEVDRCQQAVDLAVEGHQVVVVSSGDSGVYGMAGLVLELANKIPAEKRPSVDIVPGLSAVNVAASVLDVYKRQLLYLCEPAFLGLYNNAQ